MSKHGIGFWGLAAVLAFAGWCGAAQTLRLTNGDRWESAAGDPQNRFQQALAQLQQLAREGDAGDIKEALRQIKAEFPDQVEPDLDLYIWGEWYYWRDRYGKAVKKFEKMFKDYRRTQFSAPALQREFDIAQAYLEGRKKTVLGLFKMSAYEDGIELMEKISDRAGLDELEGIGLRAAIVVAEYYEAAEKYIEAYEKWSEIASYWETGPIGKRALYRMAEDNLAAYDRRPEDKRAHFDASRLTTARTYYVKFLALYPQDAKQEEVPEKIRHIDEEFAYKQYFIGEFYRRTGEHRAANLYFEMVLRSWPGTEAGALAREALGRNQAGGK
ncbi:MAG: outer membrane protein assembly factor BamD [Planctomycetes bacterium]|jgi:outer membrane protein assembly factor BamD (BamD/ComL family)|nr:outer membrane protein assembly factor BamD [Planctomycetota bacterium]